MHIREIDDDEIGRIAHLLAEGFAGRDLKFWHAALCRLSGRPKIGDLPKIGFVLEVDGNDQGVILLISSAVSGVVRSNLSSWYVREDYRKYAMFLFQRAIKAKGPVYLNLSPSIEALPIAKAFGFKPYTGGTLRLDARCAVSRASSRVHVITDALLAKLAVEDRVSVQSHLDYGCRAFVVEDHEGFFPLLYRVKNIRKIIPTARIVGGKTDRLLKSSATIARHFLLKGIPFFFLDAPRDWEGRDRIRYLPERDIRYAKNGPIPAVGDLRETEISIFFP